MKNMTTFSYMSGNSFLHRMSPLLKLILVPSLSIVIIVLNWKILGALVAVQIFTALLARFPLRKIYADLKPVLLFSAILYFLFFMNIGINLITGQKDQVLLLKNQSLSTAVMILRLASMVLTASILFNTTTQIELRRAMEKIECAVRKVLPVDKKPKFSHIIALFLCMIPLVFKIWEQTKLAWYARGGKKSFKMYNVLFPVLFSVGLKKAYNTALALTIRGE
ncbi:MAG: energy-coupling factor transporter transmembrane protein EcfT [Treponema sp.]|nr:energy-coupling factor transporter transmembrane protein EcfT [Treponema sp.]